MNSASTAPDQYAIAGTTDLSPVAEALDVNLFGAWRVTQALLPLLRSSPRPRVVNVSSEGGSIALMSGGRPAYSVSKAALNALTRMLAGELYRDGILVNAVCPGWTAGDGARGGAAGGAGGRSPRAPPAWCGRLPCPTADPPAPSPGTGANCPGRRAVPVTGERRGAAPGVTGARD